MPTFPRLFGRYPRRVELVLKNPEDVSAYQVLTSNTLDGAFTSPNATFTVRCDGFYRSTSYRKVLKTLPYSTKGLTVAIYDPEDFWAPSTTMPHDDDTSFVVIREVSKSGVVRDPGPIFVLPPPTFFGSKRPNLTVSGTAPNVAATSTGVPPEGSMHFVVPRVFDAASFRNSGSVSVFVAFGPGRVEYEVPANQTIFFPDAACSEVFVRGNAATARFYIYMAVINSEMA